jgi:hypothetical protein
MKVFMGTISDAKEEINASGSAVYGPLKMCIEV